MFAVRVGERSRVRESLRPAADHAAGTTVSRLSSPFLFAFPAPRWERGRHRMKITAFVACMLAGALMSAQQTQTPPAQPPPAPTGYQDTPMQPNGKWHVHDGTRPQPRVVTPGPLVSVAPPSDAIVLLGSGPDLSHWQMTDGGGPVSS